MKKSKILKTLAIAGTCLCAPLLLSGCTSGNENKTDFRVQGGYIQVTKDGTTWENLIDIDDLKGEDGENGNNGVGIDGREVEFQTTEYFIQWRYKTSDNSDVWRNLIDLSSLQGDRGTDGKEVEFRNTGYSIQWRYVDNSQGSEDNWEFLVDLDDIKGENGDDGATWYSGSEVPENDRNLYKYGDLFFHTTTLDIYKFGGSQWYDIANLKANLEKEKVTVEFEVNLPEYMYEFNKDIEGNKMLQTQTIDKGSWLELETFKKSGLSDYFLGWYIGTGVDETKITSYTSINDDCTLTAKWDYDKIDERYTSAGVHFDESFVYLTSDCGDVVHIAKYYPRSFGVDKIVTKVINFIDAVNTTEIILPYTANTGSIYHNSLRQNTKLKKVSWTDYYSGIMGEVPAPVNTIGDYSFAGCSSLIDINLPGYIKSIGERAFDNCTSLERLIWGGVETIGKYAFYNCSSLAKTGTVGGISLDEFYISESLKVIGNNAFEGCTSLTGLIIESTEIANLNNNDSYLFSYADYILVHESIEIDETAYINDNQGHFLRREASDLHDDYYVLDKVTK